MSFKETSLTESHLKFYFVIKDGLEDIEEVSNDMRCAFSNIREYIEEEDNIKWLQTEECTQLSKNDLTKKDIFVLEEFTGRAFEYLQTTKSLIIGPRSVLSCLMDNLSIPLGKSPIFTTAMRGLTICTSAFPNTEKTKIAKYIGWMGGYYRDDLSLSCTHLISATVKSAKYEKAAINSIPIMQSDWVYNVWECSQQENILATSPEFDKFKLPMFYKLNMTTTGISVEKKDKLVKLIQEHGGQYIGTFKSSQTDILLLEKDGVDSQKYQAAIKFKKDCLLPDWILDSVSKGYALPTTNYKVGKMKVSTPTKMEDSISVSDFNPDCTEISVISHADNPRSSCTINETQLTATSSATSLRSVQTRSSSVALTKTYKDILAQISPQQAKKAGTFLDGCCIFLCGFDADEKEKLNKILNTGGATRFDDVNEQLTHIIVGIATPNEVIALKQNESGTPVVHIGWLLASVQQKQPAAEEEFFYRAKLSVIKEPEMPSPSSKRNIQSMSFKKPALPTKKRLFIEPNKQGTSSPVASTSKHSPPSKILPQPPLAEVEENDLLSQYVQQNMSLKSVPAITSSKINEQENVPQQVKITTQEKLPSATGETDVLSCLGTETTADDTQQYTFFDGLTIYIHDHDAEFVDQIKEDCEAAGGKVVAENYKNKVDYVIVSPDVSTNISLIPVKYKNIVNNLYIDDIVKVNELVDIEYFHQPITIDPELKPLSGITIVISLYTGCERIFIESLATVLGAEKMDVYARKEKPLLICPSAEGAKYNAALKWNFPVVKSEWLVECAKVGAKISMDPYLVNETYSPDNSNWISSNKSTASVSSDNQVAEKVVQHTTPLRTETRKSTHAVDRNNPEHIVSRYHSETIDKGQDLSKMASPDFRKWAHDYAEECGKAIAESKKELLITADGSPSAKDINDSPALRHRRLSEISGSHRNSSNSSPPPLTPPPPAGLNISDIVKDFRTPVRDCIYSTLKEMWNKETPESQRLKKLAITPGAEAKSPPTPGIPLFCTTPEVEKRRLAFLDTYYLPINKKPRRPSTPLSEIKRRFWKEALGDQYWEINNTNSQLCTQTQDNVFSSPTKKADGNEDVIADSQNIPSTSTNIHVQQLTDFIKNREVETKTYEYAHEEDIDTEPMRQHDSEQIAATGEMIGWRDPSEFMPARARYTNKMRFKGTPRFSISCTNDFVKQKIIEQIKSLKGEVCKNLSTFDDTCTHIVCEKPNRGEKILSCIAAGKWILYLQYIEDSARAEHFLGEEQYEWGNPKASNLPALEEFEQKIATAAYRWRVKISNSTEKQPGVFSGFRVILHVSKKEPFQKLLTAGSGYVLNVDPPYCKSEEALQATHCLVETKKLQLSPTDHKALAESGVQVLSVMYLNAYLTSETLPDYAQYLLSL